MTIERTFLGWDRPLVECVTAFLLEGRRGKPVDLSDTLVVVPTQQAGRRLREALAATASGLWSPRVTAPGGLVMLPARPLPATPLEMEAVWLDLLQRARLSDYAALFPTAPPQQDVAWAIPLARALRRLRSALGEAGLTVAEVARGPGAETVEAERWSDLLRLEQAFLRLLRRAEREDPVGATLNAAGAPPPEGIRRVIVAGVPDLMALHRRVLQAWSDRVEVRLLVGAPANRAADFDAWGGPRVEVWAKEAIELADGPASLALCSGPAGQARKVMEWLDAARPRFDASHLAVGVPDGEVVAPLTALLAQRGLRAYDPGGRPVHEHPVAQLLVAAERLARDGNYAAFSAFARHADVLDAVAARSHSRPAEALAQLDDFQAEALPATFDAMAQRLAGAAAGSPMADLARVVEFAQAFLADLAARPPEAALRGLLQQVYAHRSVEPGTPRGEAFLAAGLGVGDALAELGRLDSGGRPLPTADFMALLMARLRDERWYPARADGAIDLEGWLELAWSDAPFVVLTGANEGMVPESQPADLFLPDSLRGRLGLRDDAARAARDAFLLKSLIESRRAGGRVALTLGRASAAGDPLKPSRLLFRCADEALPARCRLLFGEVHDPRPRPPVSVPFRLRPLQAAEPRPVERVRVTDFRAYLACPFRFYLGRVLRMEEVDDRKLELDALDFGTLVHHALQAMAESPRWRACDDDVALGDFLADAAAAAARARFGARPSLQIEFQVEAACQRLRAAARCQTAAVREGWELVEAERDLSVEWGGLRVTGRVDRIERHRARKLVRVLDYKTSDKADPPAATHLGAWREGLPAYARVKLDGRERAWRDLQLPLYRLLLEKQGAFAGEGAIQVGYFNLPKALGETGIEVWEEFDAAMRHEALNCVEGVLEDIARGRFWPPRDDVRHDEFERLFPGAAEDYVEPGALAAKGHAGGAA